MEILFEWNSTKAATNVKKHGVSFDVALRVFADPFALIEQDRFEEGELRWQTLGWVDGYMLLLVAHTVWEEEEDGSPIEVIRIISARSATKKEKRRYEQQGR